MAEPSELEKVRLVGGYIPQPLAEKLSVLALFHQETRSNIIKTLLEQQLLAAPPVAEMLDAIALRLFQTWCQTTPIAEHLTESDKFLKARKIRASHRMYIAARIEDFANAKAQQKGDKDGGASNPTTPESGGTQAQ